ncbi:hypothetical protein P171DRAFT_478303 [Karstenula rhodostoma CBS 690.94]|uniref:DUF6590 domain-containing protein n=1 Tax=Karstenula rhodostoma CBS 690.94 TaxID=1392251 RepID=A0A9P4PTV1_9PLEO|nr:hypothetical protein P171DRAFT_478303 [Karstenula rhodostoma CBS 690.94]
MVGDQDWQWSEEFQDYYKWKQRDVPGKARYDLIWGRSQLSRDEQRPTFASVPVSSAMADDSANTPNPPTIIGTDNRALPFQLSTLNFPSISEIQEQYQAPQIIQLDPTSRLNNSSPSFLYQRLDQKPPGSEDASFTTGPRTDTPTTSVGTSRSEHDASRYDDDSVRTVSPIDPQAISRINTLNITSEVGFEAIRNPRGYFKKGRVFKVIWPEPRGELGSGATLHTSSSRADTPLQQPILQANSAFDGTPGLDGIAGSTALHVKTRIFVVIRQRALHCLCLPVYTYSQQGTSKTGVKPEDHAPLVKENAEVELHPDEQAGKLRKPIYLILEDTTLQWSSLSRINLSKVQSVEYNLKVKTVGRVSPDCLTDLEALFREAIGLSED